MSDLDLKEKLERCRQDLAADEYLHGPTIDRETRVIAHDDPVSLPSLESIDNDSQNEQKKVPKTSTRS